jgi:hypothetical protein
MTLEESWIFDLACYTAGRACKENEELSAEVERLGKLCDLYAEFIAERGLWTEYSIWCTKP